MELSDRSSLALDAADRTVVAAEPHAYMAGVVCLSVEFRQGFLPTLDADGRMRVELNLDSRFVEAVAVAMVGEAQRARASKSPPGG